MEETPKKEQPDHSQLLFIADEYLVDLECLREMHASVVPFLQEIDKERKEIIESIIKSVELKKSPQVTLHSEVKKEDTANSKFEENGEEKVELNLTSSEIEVLFSNAKKISVAEQLFEKQVAVTLVSRFDEFLGKLLKLVLEQNPAWLKSSEKTITYKELIDLKSIDKAIEGVIQKEVENLLRGSHEEQISYLDEKLKLGIKDKFEKLPDFLEVAERRNLFVHTGGVVSQQYLDKCASYGIKTTDIKVGSSLGSSTEYFNNAFCVYFELGLRIAQAAYRRLFPTELAIADRALNDLAIKFMKSGDYALAKLIIEFDLGIPDKLRSQDGEYLYYAKINLAIAQKNLGENFEEGLRGTPWNVFNSKYTLCLHVLRDNFDEAAKMMGSEEIQKEIGDDGFRTWPIFRAFRGTEQFLNSYLKVFGKEFLINLGETSQINTEAEVKLPEGTQA